MHHVRVLLLSLFWTFWWTLCIYKHISFHYRKYQFFDTIFSFSFLSLFSRILVNWCLTSEIESPFSPCCLFSPPIFREISSTLSDSLLLKLYYIYIKSNFLQIFTNCHFVHYFGVVFVVFFWSLFLLLSLLVIRWLSLDFGFSSLLFIYFGVLSI